MSVFAQGIEDYTPEKVMELYSQNEAKVPSFAKKMFGNQRINVYIEDYKNFNAVTKSGKLSNLEEGSLDNPTLKVYTNKETADKLINGELDFKTALKDKLITYEVLGFWNKLKFGFITGFAVKAL